MFNDIHVAKTSKGKLVDYKRVPIQYAPRSKWLERIQAREETDKEKIAIQLPRIVYEVTSISRDMTRKIGNSVNRFRFGNNTSQFVDVPYEMSITMSIVTKTEDEMFNIVEQILPVFSPELTLRVQGLNGPSEKKTNVPVILNSVSPNDEYQGGMEERRQIIWDLEFTIKYSYAGPVTDTGSVIREVDVNPYADDGEGEQVNITVGAEDTTEDFTTTTTITPIVNES
tara:strand:- start:9792 stop:10472 length:681 start_codon:yes stop_codon:yes gene_type:complete